ncbi:MAG: hypothetical protein RR824_07440 [Clostridia bacterium]
MSVLLEINQEEKRNIVGVFDSMENAQTFVESIPFVKKTVNEYGKDYTMAFKDLPVSHTVAYGGWRYIIARDSYAPEDKYGEISLDLLEMTRLDAPSPSAGAFVEGYTSLDAYSFPNTEMASGIEKREALFLEAKEYFARQGRRVERDGLGTQDGEYVLVSDKTDEKQLHIAFLLEPQSVEAREKAGSFEAYLQSL